MHARTCSQLKGAQETSNLGCLSAWRRRESKPSATDKTPIFLGGAAQINLIMVKIISPLGLFHSLVPRLKWQITRLGGRWRLSPAPAPAPPSAPASPVERLPGWDAEADQEKVNISGGIDKQKSFLALKVRLMT